MSKTHLNYKIPAGTRVQVEDSRKLRESKKLSSQFVPYVTKKDLYFNAPCGMGWGYSVYYFRYDNWLIAVSCCFVERENKS